MRSSNISSTAISRYEKVVRTEPAAERSVSTTDRIELSAQARQFAGLVQAARSSDADMSESRVHAVLNRMASGTYRVDISRLAEKMIGGEGGGQDDA